MRDETTHCERDGCVHGRYLCPTKGKWYACDHPSHTSPLVPSEAGGREARKIARDADAMREYLAAQDESQRGLDMSKPSCDCETLRARLAALRDEQDAIAAALGIVRQTYGAGRGIWNTWHPNDGESAGHESLAAAVKALASRSSGDGARDRIKALATRALAGAGVVAGRSVMADTLREIIREADNA